MIYIVYCCSDFCIATTGLVARSEKKRSCLWNSNSNSSSIAICRHSKIIYFTIICMETCIITTVSERAGSTLQSVSLAGPFANSLCCAHVVLWLMTSLRFFFSRKVQKRWSVGSYIIGMALVQYAYGIHRKQFIDH